jgi:hypothetical protein
MTTLIKVPFASSGDKATVPVTDSTGGVNWTQGYGPDYSKDPLTDASAKRIEREEFNGLLNSLSTAINEIQVNGVAPFITAADNDGSAFAYGLGAIVITGGKVYQSLKSTNTDAVTVAASWSELCTVAKLNTELAKYAYKGGDANQAFAVAAGTDNTSAVNLGQLNTALSKKAEVGGNSANTFLVKDDTTNNNAAVTVGRLNYGLSTKANLSGDSNIDFYCRNSGFDTGAVNNQRLNYMLSSKADTAGNQYTPFNVGGATAATHAVRLDQFQSGNNGNGAWTKFPNGPMWARSNVNLNTNGSTTWTFPITFPGSPGVYITNFNSSNRIWLNGIGPNSAGIYNDGPAMNINVFAVW